MAEVFNLNSDKIWKARVDSECEGIVRNFDTAFSLALNKQDKFTANLNSVQKFERLNLFINTLLRTTVAICCQYLSPSLKVEEIVIQSIQDNFKAIRQMNAQRDAELENE